MSSELIMNITPGETRIARLQDSVLSELSIERDSDQSVAGNIYLGRITRVLPGMQAAFVDIGLEKAAFLYVADIVPDLFENLDEEEEEIEIEKPPLPPLVAQSPIVPVTDTEPATGDERPIVDESLTDQISSGDMPPAEPTVLSEDMDLSAIDEEEAMQAAEHTQNDNDAPDIAEEMLAEGDAENDEDQDDQDALTDSEDSPEDEDDDADGDQDDGADEDTGDGDGDGEEFENAAHNETSVLNAEQSDAATGRSDIIKGLTPLPATEDTLAISTDATATVLPPSTENPSPATPAPADAGSVQGYQDRGGRGRGRGRRGGRGRGGRGRGVRLASQPLPAGPTAWVPPVGRGGYNRDGNRNDAGDETRDSRPDAAHEGQAPGSQDVRATGSEAREARPDNRSGDARDQRDRDRGGDNRGERGRDFRGGGRDSRDRGRDSRGGGRDPRGARGVRTAGYASGGERKVASEGGRRDSGNRSGSRLRRGPLPRIEDLVKEGQTIVVQVAKEPIRTKGARVTSHISLPGRYLVYMPTVNHVGISRRISTYEERMRLKRIIYAHKPPSGGFICRTICAGVDEDKLVEDIKSLIQTWQNVYEKQQSSRPPTRLHTDLGIVLRTVRDNLSDDVDRLVIDSEEDHKQVISYVDRLMPELRSKIELYAKETPIFDVYGIETEINRALGKKVWLKSGGYLIIDSSEALTAIDVNTGRFVGKKDFEETIVTTNLEAVDEVAYQLKLRSIGGIIIVDFIDMVKHQHRTKVYLALKDALRRDRVKTTISKISELGLIEMTRKRTRESLTQMLSETCFHCNGTGFVKTPLTIAFEVFREIKRIYTGISSRTIQVIANPRVAKVFFNEGRERLQQMETRLGKRIVIETSEAKHIEHFEIRGKDLPALREPVRVPTSLPVKPPQAPTIPMTVMSTSPTLPADDGPHGRSGRRGNS